MRSRSFASAHRRLPPAGITPRTLQFCPELREVARWPTIGLASSSPGAQT